VPFRLLSDGYRNLLGLVADIAWRAVQLNPRHGAAAPELAEGVVLIDEIDLHLHPRWQLRVIDDLRRAFPRLQFVATTHAPQVITSAQPEWMRILRGGTTPLLAGPVHGRDANSILEDVMDVPERLPAMKARLEALARLIDAGDLERAHRLLDQIAADLGEEDASVVRARWELADAAD
jgi:predicted ATP-binding protein involved in virulence